MGFLSMSRNVLSSSKFKSKLKPLFRSLVTSPSLGPTLTLPGDGDLKPKSNKLMFLVESRFSETTDFSVISEKKLWEPDFLHPPFPENRAHAITGSCNGLYLVVDYSAAGLSLWNPNTNESKTLPRSPVWCPRYILDNTPDRYRFGDMDSYGFGFDSASNDYKALRILAYGYNLSLVELYSLNSNSWKQIAYPYPECTQIESSVHINGVCYWYTLARSDDDFILSFDFANEEFSSPANHIPVPQGIEDSYRKLVEFDGSLAIVEHRITRSGGEPFSFMVWVWNGKSWSIVLPITTIDHVSGVVGVFQRQKLFLEGEGSGELLLFDCDEKRVLENLGNIDDDSGMLCVHPYVESVIPLTGK